MGRASFKDGGVFAQNLQAGNVTVVLGGTSTDTTSVVFAKKMKMAPVAVDVTVNSDKAVTSTRAYNLTAEGFTLKAISSSLTGSCTFGYIAFDDRYR
jgi:hypothetical protein